MHFLFRIIKWLMSGAERRAMRDAPRQTEATLAGAPIRRLLVLCHGNIFRSPFVATYLTALLQARGHDIVVETAGFHPYPGRPSPEFYVAQCQELGVDLSAHRSRVADSEMTGLADAIVIMDARNWSLLMRLDPATESKLIWLGLMDGGAVEIEDPYGRSPEERAQIVARLKLATERLAGKLVEYRSP